jgi:sporulation protein YlmC with PRC-barrel domain
MERIKVSVAVALGMLIAVTAQGQTTAAGDVAVTDGRHVSTQSATELLGAKVHAADGEAVAEISDLLIDGSEIVAVELTVGGLFGIGAKRVEVPYSDLQIRESAEIVVARSESELLALSESPETTPASGRARSSGTDAAAPGAGVDAPEEIQPLPVDEDLAEIDPRLAEGIAENEEAYDEEVDEESFGIDSEE